MEKFGIILRLWPKLQNDKKLSRFNPFHLHTRADTIFTGYLVYLRHLYLLYVNHP